MIAGFSFCLKSPMTAGRTEYRFRTTVSVGDVPEDFSAHQAGDSAGDWAPDSGEDSECSPYLARRVSTIQISRYYKMYDGFKFSHRTQCVDKSLVGVSSPGGRITTYYFQPQQETHPKHCLVSYLALYFTVEVQCSANVYLYIRYLVQLKTIFCSLFRMFKYGSRCT